MQAVVKRGIRLATLIAVLSVWGVWLPSAARAAYPGENGRIAFSIADPDAQDGAIVAVLPDGGDPQEIIPPSDPTPALFPSWSADGSRLTFVRFNQRFTRSRLFTANDDGTDVALVVRSSRRLPFITGATWSPDGDRLAYCARTSGDVSERFRSRIFVVDADGSNRIWLTRGLRKVECEPSWSPDGSRIAFQSFSTNAVRIAVMNVDGTGRVIVVPRGDNFLPDWSPDGARLVFARSRRSGDVDIFTVGVDAGARARVTDDPRFEWAPVFSPDGLRIAFSRTRTHRADTATDIWTADVDGGDEVNVTNTPRLTYETDPTWQPVVP